MIWRCNSKYKDKERRCSTPHLTEDEIKAAFVRMVNGIDRKPLLADLREIQATYSSTDDLEPRLRELDERLNAEADAVQELIAENARVAQNQDDYNRQYDEMVSRFEATKAERDALAAEIRQRGIRRREFERFITTLETLRRYPYSSRHIFPRQAHHHPRTGRMGHRACQRSSSFA